MVKEGQTHYCAMVSVDSLFEGRPAELVLVFDKILAEVADWPDVLISTTPNCVVFVHRKTFLVIRPMQKVIDVKFYSEKAINGYPVLNSLLYGRKYANNVRINAMDQLTAGILKFIHQSYHLL